MMDENGGALLVEEEEEVEVTGGGGHWWWSGEVQVQASGKGVPGAGEERRDLDLEAAGEGEVGTSRRDGLGSRDLPR
jgi:hypothetical protein